MKVTYAFFAAHRYWADLDALKAAYEEMKKANHWADADCALIVDGEGADALKGGADSVLVIVPMSGAVQQGIVDTAAKYAMAVVYAGYVKGNASQFACAEMVKNNAAPTVMDCWSVLRRSKPYSQIALNMAELSTTLRVLDALLHVKSAKMLMIGKTEPWVISASREMSVYEKLGITIECVEQSEVIDRYHATTAEQAKPYYEHFMSSPSKIVEPTDEDILNASRMASAVVETLKAHDAQGMAISCFNLLATGTNTCLAVSYINDCTPWVAACEGDMDSAVTMMMMKRLSSCNLWMANPGLHPNGMVNFSHCTAPLNMTGGSNCAYQLRNHHESGIGASLQVELPVNHTVTACRISGVTGQATVQLGQTQEGEYETACRTQAYVKFDDFDHYINTALGCHQVFTFADISKEMQQLAKMMGLELI